MANCCDKFGNYAMQSLLENGTALQVRQLIHFLGEHVQELVVSCHGCSVLGKAMSVGRKVDQIYLHKAISAVPGVLKIMSSSKKQAFLARAMKTLERQEMGIGLESQ